MWKFFTLFKKDIVIEEAKEILDYFIDDLYLQHEFQKDLIFPIIKTVTREKDVRQKGEYEMITVEVTEILSI